MNKYGIIFIVISLLSPLTMAGPMMYVPTGSVNEIVIIDLNTDTVVGRIDELENAHGLSSSPNSEYLVAGSMQPLQTGMSSDPKKTAAVSDTDHAAHHKGGGSDRTQSAGKSYLSILGAKSHSLPPGLP